MRSRLLGELESQTGRIGQGARSVEEGGEVWGEWGKNSSHEVRDVVAGNWGRVGDAINEKKLGYMDIVAVGGTHSSRYLLP